MYLRESVTKSATRVSNPSGINRDLVEKERQSLANFEDFENTLLILENNKTEEEFDDLLNSFSANIRNPISQKVRQSLDNIKKRHSSIGMEKQQQDELNREKALNTSKNGKYSESANEKNRLNESLGRSTMVSSMSSSGERLLRRSRLFDDVIHTSTEKISDNGVTDHINTSHEYADNKLNSTQTLNKKNQEHFGNESIPETDTTTTVFNTDGSNAESKMSNRDRFKTIRIFKKPPENAIQIPDPDETYVQEVQTPVPMARNFEAFSTKNTNSPKRHELNVEQHQHEPKPINTMTFKRSGLARPRQLNGLAKHDLYAKSNSHEFLSSEEHIAATQPKPVQQIKSPMGFKSKSIHNLSTARTSTKPLSRFDEQMSTTRNQTLVSLFTESLSLWTILTGEFLNLQSSHTFKIPAPKSSLATMRQRPDASGQPRKIGLMRPSSGYYGYNTRRTDSDTDLGRFSSNNVIFLFLKWHQSISKPNFTFSFFFILLPGSQSLSSGSSKSSLSRGETPETFTASNDNANATFVQQSQKMSCVPSRAATMNGGSGIAPPKLSLLRQPNPMRRSALPRPAASITKR